MGRAIEAVLLKKELIRAKSTLYRLKFHRDVQHISSSLRWVSVGSQIFRSIPFRSTLLGLLLKSGRKAGFTRALAFSGKLVLFAKITKSLLHLIKRSKESPYRYKQKTSK